MSFTRFGAVPGLQCSLKHVRPRFVPRLGFNARTQLVAGRRYASGGSEGGHAGHSPDWPWMLGALVVTPPACWYLWPRSHHADSGHDAHHGEGAHDEHGTADEKEEAPAEEEAPQEEEAPEESSGDVEPEKAAADSAQEQEEPKDSEETVETSGTDDDSQPTASGANKESTGTEDSETTAKPEGGTDVKFKGGMHADSSGHDDTRKREPDSKGGFKKRIDSGLQKNLGEGPEFADEEGDTPRREAAASAKPAQKGSEGDISGKQFGLSNTATRHSLQIDQDPEKSKKGEGTPETAKSMGTVDPKRPQV